MLCARIEQLLSAQSDLLAVECPAALEREAQRCAAQYLAQHGQAREEPTASQSARAPEVQAVEVDSLTLAFPRSAGVEHVGLWAMRAASGLCPWLSELGLSGPQRAAVVGSVIGRMAAPASERATYQWLCERSGLGEARGRGLRGDARDQAVSGLRPTAKAPEPLTLGLVLDGSGFVRRAEVFAGNATESDTLEGMLKGLEAPSAALVVMDRGIATEENLQWLRESGYRYLVVSRERIRQFEPSQARALETAAGQTVHLQKVLSEDGREVRLYCHSAERAKQEEGISGRFVERFEAGLQKLADGLAKRSAREAYRQAVGAHRAAKAKQPWHRPALPDRDHGRRGGSERGVAHLGACAGARYCADSPRGVLPALE